MTDTAKDLADNLRVAYEPAKVLLNDLHNRVLRAAEQVRTYCSENNYHSDRFLWAYETYARIDAADVQEDGVTIYYDTAWEANCELYLTYDQIDDMLPTLLEVHHPAEVAAQERKAQDARIRELEEELEALRGGN